MSKDVFKDRERAFEAVYFARVNAELIETIHKEREDALERGLLARATGIEDESLLQRMLDLGIDTKHVQAMALVPLVCVAWSSGGLDRKERRAFLEAAEAEGIAPDSSCHPLLDVWLDHRPQASLFETWRDYIQQVLRQLDEPHRTNLRSSLMKRGKQIAKASGGFLGVGKISEGEHEMLDRIEAALVPAAD